MTQPAAAPAFLGFAGWPVPPPWQWRLGPGASAAQHEPGEVAGYFRDAGVRHADNVAEVLLRQRRLPNLRPLDLVAGVDNYAPDPGHAYAAGSADNTGAYTRAFLDRLVHKADRLRDMHRGGGVPAPDDLADMDPAMARWFRHSVAELPASDLLAVAGELDSLAQALAAKTGIAQPSPPTDEDRRREPEAQDRAGTDDLAAAIDEYSLHRTMPFLHSPDRTEQAAERDRRAARIAVLDAQNPHLRAGLTLARSQVVRAIVPESAVQDDRRDGTQPLRAAPAADEALVRALSDDADRLAIHLLLDEVVETFQRSGTAATLPRNELLAFSPQDPARSRQRAELADRIAALHRDHPDLVHALPPMQAGLVRGIRTIQALSQDDRAPRAAEMAAKAGTGLPLRLAERDRRREQEAADRARLDELSAVIDQYSRHQAAPWLRSASSAEQQAVLVRLAARVAVLDTRNPHLLASLTPDRARVVHALVPESAAREHRADWPPPQPQELAPREVADFRLDPDSSARIQALLDRVRQWLRERGIPAERPEHAAAPERGPRVAAEPLATQQEQGWQPHKEARPGTGPARPGAHAQPAGFATAAEIVPDGTPRPPARPESRSRTDALREELPEMTGTKFELQGMRGGPAVPGRTGWHYLATPHDDEAPPAPQEQKPVQRPRAERPGTAASRHGGPAQPPGPGRAR
ncbi:hypothetical protein [Amycolatopsis rubida]|uniref:Uncharacterized protein n=1 Tax=Amycolatopsis rubida TaxID=112413 RepID=A0A1I5XHE9_9PSEU|nr:hypothetical protein [Amycolatopsis rubida]SFQ31077.1 hypothetical protein SAMN05421854_110217 [Amycolatopsis rubida]